MPIMTSCARLLLLPILPLCACQPGFLSGLPAGDREERGEGDTSSRDTSQPETLGSPCEDLSYPDVVIHELVASNVQGLLDADEESSDWLELRNLDSDPVDLAGWGLSDDDGDSLQWVFPSLVLDPDEIVLVFASGKESQSEELHANFSIDAFDAQASLAGPEGCIVDQIGPGRLYADISYGRTQEDAGTWGYFMEPTPGLKNDSESRPGFAPTPELSPQPGFYDDAVTVSASCESSSATLRLTFDGAAPSEDSELYEAPFEVTGALQPAVVRARAWMDGLWPSRIATATYSSDPTILEDDLKVVSLVVDPFDLYDEETGIYAYGPPDYTSYYPYFGANFWEDWERDAHIQIWEPDGSLVIDQDAGVKIHGGYTVAFNQKSFRILARSGYGPDTLAYKFFPNDDLDAFEIIVLEGAGDWCPTHTENAVVPVLFRDQDGVRFPSIDAQAWEPTVVYLNGQFWGLYAFREKLDEHFIEARHGADPDNLDRIECTADGTADWWRIQQGDWVAFDELNEFAAQNDLSDPEAWAEFKTMVDIENMASAVLAQGYWGNTDWWDNNLRMWRERKEEGPFRHMIFDFSHSWPSYTYDHFGVSVGWSGDGLPIANALQNEEFRVLLANQASDFLNTNLAVENALPRVDEMHARIEPVIADQYATWCGQPKTYWDSLVLYSRQFVQERPAILRTHVMQHLGLPGVADLTLEADPAGAGSFRLTVVEVDPPFTGAFFQGIPISVTALPAQGYELAGWSDGSLGEEASVSFELDGDASLTAYFQ